MKKKEKIVPKKRDFREVVFARSHSSKYGSIERSRCCNSFAFSTFLSKNEQINAIFLLFALKFKYLFKLNPFRTNSTENGASEDPRGPQ